MWYSRIDSATLWTVAVTQFAQDVNDGQELLTWPEGVDPNGSFYEPFRDQETGMISLVENTQKKLDAQWASVRGQQRQKLYESDWTCSVIDPPPEILAQRDQWLQYRADLRAVTTQSDPFAIVWPLGPVVETPVVQEAEPAVETPVVQEAEPVEETPVVQEAEPVEAVVETPVVEVAEPVVTEVTEPQ